MALRPVHRLDEPAKLSLSMVASPQCVSVSPGKIIAAPPLLSVSTSGCAATPPQRIVERRVNLSVRAR